MEGERSTQPDDRREDDEVAPPGHTLSDPNRVHVTLENLVDLAKLDTVRWSPTPPDQAADPAGSPAALESPRPPGRPASPPGEPESLPRRQPSPPMPAAHPFPPPLPSPPAGPQPLPQLHPSPPVGASRASQPQQASELMSSAPQADQPWHSGELPAQPSRSQPAEAAADPALRARWARPAQRWLPEALALGLASGAFVFPSVWLLATAVVCVVAGCVTFVASGHPLRTLPWRALRRGVSLLHPRSSTWAPVLVARVVLVSVVVPGAIAAALWLADEGRMGVVPAARAGAWTHGFRVAGALACILLLTSVGDGRLQRAEKLRRLARPLSDGTLVLLVVGSCLAAALAAMAMPHPKDPVASSADGLGWLPAPARGPADRVRDDIVTAELDSLASCLSKRSSARWQTSYTSANAASEPDVARLLVAGADSTSPPPHDLVAVLMAAHNQLAPWVETIEVRLASDDVVRVDRTGLARHRPLTDPAKLTSATTGLQRLAVGPVDVTLALRCSAGVVI